MHALWSFARAPLAWSFAILALCAPLAFIEPVVEPPPCDDWLWCSERYVGLVFDPTPDLIYLFALLIVPAALIAFFAAGIAARGRNRRAHWFMSGLVLALIAGPVFLAFFPMHLLFLNSTDSYRPALIVTGLQSGLLLGVLAALAVAIVTLLGALAWRFRPRGRMRNAARPAN